MVYSCKHAKGLLTKLIYMFIYVLEYWEQARNYQCCMSCTSTFFTLYGELPATYQAGADLLLLSHSLKLEEIMFLWLKSQLVSLWFCSLSTVFSSRNSWDGQHFFRKIAVCKFSLLHCRIHSSARVEKLRCLQGKICFCLESSGVPPGSSAPEEHNRKEGLGKWRERPANCVPVVFKGGELTAYFVLIPARMAGVWSSLFIVLFRQWLAAVGYEVIDLL